MESVFLEKNIGLFHRIAYTNQVNIDDLAKKIILFIKWGTIGNRA